MRTRLLLLLTSLLLVLAGCQTKPEEPKGPPPPEYRPTGTIKDLMDSVVDPNADFLWDAVATTVSAKGIDEKLPRTDEEWKEVRRHAVALVEATNLLIMPGRRVAKVGEKADDPKVELSPEQIQALIDMDRKTWEERAHGLHDAAMASLKAIDMKSAEELLNTGDALDQACEKCHLIYWYPNEAKREPAAAGEPSSRSSRTAAIDMKRYILFLLAASLFAAQALAQTGTGTIKGHVRLTLGDLPGNDRDT